MNFDDLKQSVANLTLYDVKSAVRKVQNVVMNYTEMETKVGESGFNERYGKRPIMSPGERVRR